MTIEEPDFKIKYDNSCYILYLLKTKKEIKDETKTIPKEILESTIDPVEVFKTQGYYSVLYYAIKAALKWRMDSKYPFKESHISFYNSFLEYNHAIKDLELYSKKIYDPINVLKKEIFDGYKQFLIGCKRQSSYNNF